jgi:hypothetical protein
MDSTTVWVDLGSIHRSPSFPPSVPTGPPTVVVGNQPHVDRVLLEKKDSSGETIYDET